MEGIILGRDLARLLGARLGMEVTSTTAESRLTPLGLQPRPRLTRFRVVGIFSAGLYEYDSKWAYISLAAAQRLAGGGETAGVIQMKVDDIYAVEQIAAQVRSIAGPDFMTTSWQELNRPLFAALRLQQRVVVVFFALLIAMAALNIVTTLMMTVIEKHRDIAILRAQGATPRSIRRIFRLQGLIIGLGGAATGLLLGLLLVNLANAWKLISIPAEIYSVASVRLEIRWVEALAVAALAVIISLLATIYPARAAGRLAPVEALRYE
jgi:lipoprotein-releasing system permease protein